MTYNVFGGTLNLAQSIPTWWGGPDGIEVWSLGPIFLGGTLNLAQSNPLPASHNPDDLFKVMGSKFKVVDNIFQKCPSPVQTYQSTLRLQRRSNLCSKLWHFQLLC